MATSISLLIFAAAITLYIVTLNSWKEATVVLEVGRSANLAMERLLRGFKSDSDSAPRGLLDAKAFILDNPAKIRFTSGIDLKERSFYLEADKLMYDPDTSAALDEREVADNIASLSFADASNPPKKNILINLSASKEVKGAGKTISLSSKVYLRNG